MSKSTSRFVLRRFAEYLSGSERPLDALTTVLDDLRCREEPTEECAARGEYDPFFPAENVTTCPCETCKAWARVSHLRQWLRSFVKGYAAQRGGRR